jgi:ABC-2 type transport system ATP-binding protein
MSDNQIVVDNLSKAYNNGFKALKGVSLNIKKGEILAMLGPNGAGKTILLTIIERHDQELD